MNYKLTLDGIVPFTAEEQAQWEKDVVEMAAQLSVRAAKESRADRNLRLAECDWVDLPTCSLSDAKKQAWAVYRQALRDVPAQPGFPENITWPQKPA